jgi:hypothetical protein
MSILSSEWFKLRKSGIIFIILAGPFVGFMIGLLPRFPNDLAFSEWYMLLIGTNLTYALLFLPLISGVLASVICRYEHQAGSWKQLLALPVSRWKVFTAKYVVLILLMLVMQLLYLCSIYGAGMIKGFTDPFPIDIVWKSIFGGWVATLPLVSLQLGMSIFFRSFAAPFAVNVVFTLPSILAANSERFGPYYPWVQPFFMMNIGGGTDNVFFVPWDQLLIVVGGSFIVFFACSLWYFYRKPI